MNNIIDKSYEIRQAEIDRRHQTNSLNSKLRKELAQEMSPGLSIDRDRGFMKYPTSQLPEAQDVIFQGENLMLNVNHKKNRRKIALLEDADYKDPSILETPIFKLALNPSVIATASDYLGYIPILTTANFWLNLNLKTGDSQPKENEYITSMYHMDWADHSLVKVFVFCVDINSDNGAMILVNPEKSSEIRSSINYRYEQKLNSSKDSRNTNGLYIADDIVNPYLDEKDTFTMEGDKGTVYFADTARCFHFGGRNSKAGKERLLAVIQYLRPGALKLSTTFNDNPPFQHLVNSSMTQLNRLVLGSS